MLQVRIFDPDLIIGAKKKKGLVRWLIVEWILVI